MSHRTTLSCLATKPRNSKDQLEKVVTAFLLESYSRVGQHLYYQVHSQYVFLLALRDDVQSTLLADEGDRQADQHVSQATFPTVDATER